jgi:anti-sigma factor RsiW
MFTCEDCAELFPDLVDGRCDSKKHRELVAWLESRELCRRCFDSYRMTATLCRQALQHSPSPQATERLLAFLRDEANRSAPRSQT